MCTAQLSVESPLSCVKETLAVSLRVALSVLTEPESLGHPEPEKTMRVIVGEEGGAARAKSGRVASESRDRIGGDGGEV